MSFEHTCEVTDMRKVFFSFDWDDVWKVNQIRNSWVTKGSYESAGFMDKADIEQVKLKTDQEIMKWIDKQLEGASVTCVLIGGVTACSNWVKYEIASSIEKEKGLLGVYINSSNKGPIPSELGLYHYTIYDWETDRGQDYLGDWIEAAAQQAGR